jgi:hypothetical protein
MIHSHLSVGVISGVVDTTKIELMNDPLSRYELGLAMSSLPDASTSKTPWLFYSSTDDAVAS